MFLFGQPKNKWMNTCLCHLRGSICPLDALLTVPSYIARDHHHCQPKVYYIHYKNYVTYKRFIGISDEEIVSRLGFLEPSL